MDLLTQFSSPQNKHFLWDFITKNHWFDNIPNAQHHNVKTMFEKTIIKVKQENTKTTLVDYNKIFLTIIKNNLDTIKTNKKKVDFEDLKDRHVNTIEEQHKDRQLQFNNELKAREDDFISLIKKPTPQNVEFKDINRELKIKNMEDHIEKIVEERNSQINSIFHDNTKDNSKRTPSKTKSIVENDSVENDSVENDSVENDSVENDSVENDSVENEAAENIPVIDISVDDIIIEKKTTTNIAMLENKIANITNNIAEIQKTQQKILEKLDKIKII